MNESTLVLLFLAALALAAPNLQAPDMTSHEDFASISFGYDRIKDFGYYKFSENESVWADAWRTCFEDNAHLMVIRSMEEFDEVNRWMRKYSDQTPLLLNYGVHHRFQSGVFYTIFDEPLDEVGYNAWGNDFSDHNKYNNVDFPIVLIDIGYGEQPGGDIPEKGIYLQKYVGQPEHFICKRDINNTFIDAI